MSIIFYKQWWECILGHCCKCLNLAEARRKYRYCEIRISHGFINWVKASQALRCQKYEWAYPRGMSLEFGEYCSKVLVISIIPFKMDPLFSDVSCFSSKPRPHHLFLRWHLFAFSVLKQLNWYTSWLRVLNRRSEELRTKNWTVFTRISRLCLIITRSW